MTKRLTLLFVLLFTVSLSAQWTYLAYEQITVAATSIGITATTLQPNGVNTQPQARVGSCRAETGQMRYRVDGVAPTASVGTLIEIGDIVALQGPDVLRNFRAIRTGATSGVLNCSVAQ